VTTYHIFLHQWQEGSHRGWELQHSITDVQLKQFRFPEDALLGIIQSMDYDMLMNAGFVSQYRTWHVEVEER
jgi:hypothetical protein